MFNSLPINIVAKIMKMSSDTIRFYEKKHIIHPKREENNNYRSFRLEDIQKLNDCRNFRNLQYSMKEIDYLMHEATADEWIGLWAEKQAEIDEKIKELQIAKQRLSEIISDMDEYEHYIGRYQIKEYPESIAYFYGLKAMINYDVMNTKEYSRVMDHQNLFRCTVRIERTDDGAIDEKVDFGFSMSLTKAHKYNIPCEEPAERIKLGKCIYTVIEITGIICRDDLNPVITWIENHDYKSRGNIIGNVVKVIYDKGKEIRNYELWIPIE